MNSQYFSKEQVIAGELNEFLEVLLKQCYGKSDCYNDIHIKPEDCGAFVIEWEKTPWSGEWGGHWQYIKDDEEEVVMKYYYFPDDHYELFEREEQYQEALKDWLEEHKEEGWYKNEWGQWRSKKSEEEWKKNLEEDDNEQLDEDEANDEFLYNLRSKHEDKDEE